MGNLQFLQIDHTTNTTFKAREVKTYAVRIALHLHKMQLKQDDIIGFAVKNTIYVLPAVVGCFFNCSPPHPVNPTLDECKSTSCVFFFSYFSSNMFHFKSFSYYVPLFRFNETEINFL